MEVGKNALVFIVAIKIALIIANLILTGSVGSNVEVKTEFSWSDILHFVGLTVFNFLVSLGVPEPISALAQTFVYLSLFLYLRSLGFGTIATLIGTTLLG